MSTISIQTRKFADLAAITSAPEDAMLLIHDGKGVKKISAENLKADLVALIKDLHPAGAGAHNSVYRGKNLGTAVTPEQWEAIQAGTFEDLYIGDYWVIGGVNWRIAAFDYYLHKGNTECTTHHAVIVPDSNLYQAKYNETDITKGGYVGSVMYQTNLAAAKSTIRTVFGSEHVLNHRRYLTNAVSSAGAPSGGAWFDSTVELMTERNVYGAPLCSPMGNGEDPWITMHNFTIDYSQFPLFAFDQTKICNGDPWWLRDIITTFTFACVLESGNANYKKPSVPAGVRPVFSLC